MLDLGRLLGLAAITKSEITIKDVSYKDLGIIPDVFRKLGIELELRGDDLFIPSQESYKITHFIAG